LLLPGTSLGMSCGPIAGQVRNALRRARGGVTLNSGPSYLRANLLGLPLPSSAFDTVLDRGCFHYLTPATGRAIRQRLAAC